MGCSDIFKEAQKGQTAFMFRLILNRFRTPSSTSGRADAAPITPNIAHEQTPAGLYPAQRLLPLPPSLPHNPPSRAVSRVAAAPPPPSTLRLSSQAYSYLCREMANCSALERAGIFALEVCVCVADQPNLDAFQ